MSLTLSIFNFPTTSGDWKHFVYTSYNFHGVLEVAMWQKYMGGKAVIIVFLVFSLHYIYWSRRFFNVHFFNTYDVPSTVLVNEPKIKTPSYKGSKS